MSRQRAVELEISEGELVVARSELDDLHDAIYVLACAVDDTERDLADAGGDASVSELREMLAWLLDAAKPLRERQISVPTGRSRITS